MVDLTAKQENVASLVVPHHFNDAMKALDSFKVVKGTALTG